MIKANCADYLFKKESYSSFQRVHGQSHQYPCQMHFTQAQKERKYETSQQQVLSLRFECFPMLESEQAGQNWTKNVKGTADKQISIDAMQCSSRKISYSREISVKYYMFYDSFISKKGKPKFQPEQNSWIPIFNSVMQSMDTRKMQMSFTKYTSTNNVFVNDLYMQNMVKFSKPNVVPDVCMNLNLVTLMPWKQYINEKLAKDLWLISAQWMKLSVVHKIGGAAAYENAKQ